MENQNYTASILVAKDPKTSFDAIKNFRGWWSEEIEGKTDQSGEIFVYHYKDIHLCKMKLIEAQLGKKLVYLVPEYECYKVCYDAWSNYIKSSLYNLITTGNGQPNPKDKDGFNAQLAEKWKVN